MLKEFSGFNLSMIGEMSRESQVFAEFSPDFRRILAYDIFGPI